VNRRTTSVLGTWWQFRRQQWRSLGVRLLMAHRGVYIGEGARIPGGGTLSFAPTSTVQRFAVLNAGTGAVIRIGRGSRIGAFAVISAVREIDIGDDVLIADRVFITDHQHESEDRTRPVMEQGVGPAARVAVGAGCWLGVNVCLMPGVSLGQDCIVGAGSVVTRSFPAGSILAGVPARLLRQRSDDGR
jgi:acetyltransferase-like isoleucine patch superfamily enzyme